MRDMRNRLGGAMRTPVAIVVVGALSMVLAWGCTTADERLGIEIPRPAPTPGFVVPDAGPDVIVRELASYCPSDKCPSGFTTCPGSRFPCDVNLQADINNCGACGLACPTDTGAETFACVNGACAMTCKANSGMLDCDGLVDNGCEATALHDNHCGACGKKCTDPAKRCVDQSGRAGLGLLGCGCPAGKLYCDRGCYDPKNDDEYCGDCSTKCDPSGPSLPAVPHAYYGCVNSQCGKIKCEQFYANCDGQTPNGCETFLVDDANCGSCGNACPSGEACRLDQNNIPRCMCPAGLTYCESYCIGDVCTGQCVDLTSDRGNCGACGNGCYVPARNAISLCNYGTCVMDCNDGRADCNSSEADGCETNIDSDPRNCGACGNVCDAVAGQACVAGRCAVEPCPESDAGGTTK